MFTTASPTHARSRTSHAIIRDLGLRQPIYRQTAAYGHFGRDDIQLPWERTDKAEALKSAAGL